MAFSPFRTFNILTADDSVMNIDVGPPGRRDHDECRFRPLRDQNERRSTDKATEGDAALAMGVGPPEPPRRRRLQTATSCAGPTVGVVSVVGKGAPEGRRRGSCTAKTATGGGSTQNLRCTISSSSWRHTPAPCEDTEGHRQPTESSSSCYQNCHSPCPRIPLAN